PLPVYRAVREFEAALRTIEASRSQPGPTVAGVPGLRAPSGERQGGPAQGGATGGEPGAAGEVSARSGERQGAHVQGGATPVEPGAQVELRRRCGPGQRWWPLRAARGAADRVL